ncbi:MAG: hypothetical protein U1E12_12580, partial [Hydrogenophaga sp.]|uniref:hypothetical protein n=1 Tax=Hydrogenophaga sp. TaxID=1904254 RepID=UPI002ABAB776
IYDTRGQAWRVRSEAGKPGRTVVIERVESQQVRAEQLMRSQPEIHEHFRFKGFGAEVKAMFDYYTSGKSQQERAIEQVGRGGIQMIKPKGEREVSFETAEGSPQLKAQIYELKVKLKDGRLHKIEVAIPAKNWDAAISGDLDRNSRAGQKAFVSEYARTSVKEDFAETVMLYLASDGGAANPPAHLAQRLGFTSGAELRAHFKDRFAVLDQYFEAHPSQLAAMREQAPKTLRNLLLGLGAVGLAGGYVYQVSQEEEQK